ncbi:DUF2516 family protein [Rothia sp. P6271]|uniref:DUF2516 family protein n=1 Tax=unclassified Rothia (in: high G+C Gram-positive bacteria) TaxID=2689056 RepID=UPI003ACB5DEB
MSPLSIVVYFQWGVSALFALVVAGLSLWALLDAVRATDYAYQSAFKRTKTFWVALTGGSVLASALALLTLSQGGVPNLFFQLFAAIAAGVFLADVRPVVTVRRNKDY